MLINHIYMYKLMHNILCEFINTLPVINLNFRHLSLKSVIKFNDMILAITIVCAIYTKGIHKCRYIVQLNVCDKPPICPRAD